MFLAKLSVLWPMLRIFSPMKTGIIFWCTHALIWANFLFYITGSLALVFQCHPRERIWNPFVTGSCAVDGFALFIASTAFNAVSDLLMLVLPLYSIWHLRMAIKRKVGVSIVFATGLLYDWCPSLCHCSQADTIQRGDYKYCPIKIFYPDLDFS